jgi:hypothetical protein
LKALVSAKISIFFLRSMILWNIGIVCFIIELHQFTSGTPYNIPQKENKAYKWSLYHSRDHIAAASRRLQFTLRGRILSEQFWLVYFG